MDFAWNVSRSKRRKAFRPRHLRSRSDLRAERLESRDLPAVVVGQIPITAVEGMEFRGQVATFLKTDVLGDAAKATVAIDWGDGTARTVGVPALVSGSVPETYTVDGRKTYSKNGRYQVVVTVTGEMPPPAVGQGTAVASLALISTTPITLTATSGAPFVDEVVARFTSDNLLKNAADFSAIIDFGDLTDPVIAKIRPEGPGMFSVLGSHTYAMKSAGYSIKVTILTPGSDPIPVVSTAIVVAGSPVLPALVTSPATVTATAGVPLVNAVVARFTSAILKQATDFAATVDFGDQTSGIGTIRDDGGGAFSVLASHTYATKNAGITIVVTILPAGAASIVVMSQAIVVDAVPGPSTSLAPFVGRLSPESDTGISSTDGVTNTNQPTFVGTSGALSLILLYGKRTDADQYRFLGRVVTGADGRWTLTVGPLADGPYIIMATETPNGGATRTSTLYGPNAPLIIDTVAPRVRGLAYAPNGASALLVLSDNASGLVMSQVVDSGKYKVSGSNRQVVAVTSVSPPVAFDGQSYSLQLRLQKKLGTTKGQVSLVISGVADAAGNVVYGQFFSKSLPPAFRAIRRAFLGILKS